MPKISGVHHISLKPATPEEFEKTLHFNCGLLGLTVQARWTKPDGTMLVGITDYAQDQLGGVIFVDLPAVGEHFKQGVSCASIESVKITSDAIIPVSGEIVAVNETLADAPELLNDSPYDKGWLVRVKPDDADEGGRISAAEYAALVG